MKVTKEKRDEIRRSLVAAAVELFSEQGLADTSLREIAARAGVAPGTVYKYFADRDKLFYAYFEIRQDDALASLRRMPDFETWSLKEKLQGYVEALISEYVENREFVAVALKGLVESPLQSYGALQQAKQKVIATVEGFFQQAVKQGEIPGGPYDSFLIHLFWDYTSIVTLFWLKDDSEDFSRTSEFVDVSLELFVELIQGGVIEKGVKVGAFLLRSHLYGNLDRFLGLLSLLKVPPRSPKTEGVP